MDNTEVHTVTITLRTVRKTESALLPSSLSHRTGRRRSANGHSLYCCDCPCVEQGPVAVGWFSGRLSRPLYCGQFVVNQLVLVAAAEVEQ